MSQVKQLILNLESIELLDEVDSILEGEKVDSRLKMTFKALGVGAIGALGAGMTAAGYIHGQATAIQKALGLEMVLPTKAGQITGLVAFPLLAAAYLIYKAYSNVGKHNKKMDEYKQKLENRIKEKENLINSGEISGKELDRAKQDVEGAKEYLAKM